MLMFLCFLNFIVGPSCSQTISGERHGGIIQSYNYPFDYPHNLTCHYNIHVTGGSASNKIICFNFHRYNSVTYTYPSPIGTIEVFI